MGAQRRRQKSEQGGVHRFLTESWERNRAATALRPKRAVLSVEAPDGTERAKGCDDGLRLPGFYSGSGLFFRVVASADMAGTSPHSGRGHPRGGGGGRA